MKMIGTFLAKDFESDTLYKKKKLFQTIIGARKESLILVCMPWRDLNEIGNKRWNQTFDDGRISAYHVLLVNVGFVVLCDNWEKIMCTACSNHKHTQDIITFRRCLWHDMFTHYS